MNKKSPAVLLTAVVAVVGCGGGGGAATPSTPSTHVASWTQISTISIPTDDSVLGTAVLNRPDGSKVIAFNGPQVITTPAYAVTCNQVALHAFKLDSAGALTDATAVMNSVTTSIHTREMVTADFNGDGIDDLFVGNHGCDDASKGLPVGETNQAFLSSGGQFTDVSASLAGYGNAFTHSVTAAVTGASSNVDVLVGSMSFPGAYILRGDGAGHFTQDTVSLSGTIPKFASSLFVDVNGDSKPDLVIGSDQTSNEAGYVYLNDGTGKFNTAAIPLPVGFDGAANTIVLDIASTDVNNDSKPDLILSTTQNAPTYYGNGALQILINDGTGHFADKTAQYMPVQNNKGWTQFVHVVDLDGDGKLDILQQMDNPQAADVIAYRNTGSGYQALDHSNLPASMKSLIPVNVGGQLILVSMVSSGSSTMATAYQFK
jgi:hypothetical protein